MGDVSNSNYERKRSTYIKTIYKYSSYNSYDRLDIWLVGSLLVAASHSTSYNKT